MTVISKVPYREPESFIDHNGQHYALNQIFAVAGLLPVSEMSIAEISLDSNLPVDESRVEAADISIPIIVTDGAVRNVIDGIHRLTKLVRMGVKQINCVVVKSEWFQDGIFLATTPHAWFLEGCQNGRHHFKEWVLRMFAVTELPTTYSDLPIKDEQFLANQTEETRLNTRDYWPIQRDGMIGYSDALGRFVECVGLTKNQAIVAVNDVIVIDIGDIPNLKQPTVTLVGNVLFNYLTVVYAFGSKIPFQMGKVKISKVEKLIINKLVDDVDDPSQETDDKIYVRELKRWIKSATALAGLATICVPAATPRTILPHPEAAALRKRLVERYQGQLHDPAKIAMIAKELETLDREWCAGDPDAGFYQSDKSFGVIRMKMFGIFGAEQNFRQGGYTFIEQPLEEGWNLEQLPAMIDSLRDGSYNRGAETALGGYEVKTILRTMSGSVIAEEDCGSTIGLTTGVSQQNVSELLGHTVILPKGEQLKVTAENFQSLVGKTVELRTPGFCKTTNNNFCQTCFGDFIADKKQALGVVASELGSRLLLLFMKKMHGTSLKTVKFQHKLRIS